MPPPRLSPLTIARLSSSSVHLPIPVSGSDVRFAEYTVPHGPTKEKPPAHGRVSSTRPSGGSGVWPPTQWAIGPVRYSPYFTGSFRDGSGTDLTGGPYDAG